MCKNTNNQTERMDISKYLIYLDDEGWSELICSRWEKEVKQTLLTQFPEMTEEEWKRISEIVFW